MLWSMKRSESNIGRFTFSSWVTFQDHINAFSCSCVPGYTGKTCETNIDDCQAAPCQNNATCVDSVNAYTCRCLDGFNGTNCEHNIDDCSPNPCLNRGECCGVAVAEVHGAIFGFRECDQTYSSVTPRKYAFLSRGHFGFESAATTRND